MSARRGPSASRDARTSPTPRADESRTTRFDRLEEGIPHRAARKQQVRLVSSQTRASARPYRRRTSARAAGSRDIHIANAETFGPVPHRTSRSDSNASRRALCRPSPRAGRRDRETSGSLKQRAPAPCCLVPDPFRSSNADAPRLCAACRRSSRCCPRRRRSGYRSTARRSGWRCERGSFWSSAHYGEHMACAAWPWRVAGAQSTRESSSGPNDRHQEWRSQAAALPVRPLVLDRAAGPPST